MNNKASNQICNNITSNAFEADDASVLIKKATRHVRERYGWKTVNEDTLFTGTYYDSQKVGSLIIKVENEDQEKAALKLQLRPLAFDEGFIIRHIDRASHSQKIRTPQIIHDQPWQEGLGFGFIIFEDLSHLPDLWSQNTASQANIQRHAEFLKEFFDHFLPVDPWLEKPRESLAHLYRVSLDHFEQIASESRHHHLDSQVISEMKDRYFQIIASLDLGDPHFTHGHLSGHDVKYDQSKDQFILMANLYWSYRPLYYELTFPIWVDITNTRDESVTLAKLLAQVEGWTNHFQSGLLDHDPTMSQLFWFNLLQRAILTVMLDLGASEWPQESTARNQTLLNSWREFFYWIADHQLK